MIALCAATVFLSALLLFWVQPMFTKSVLPLLGGTPAVWNTALVFFQATLLLGYLYVHASARWLSFRAQAVLHLALLCLAWVALPIGVAAGWTPPAEALPIPWLLGLFAVSLGLPFFAVSATAPLVQKWLARTDHPSAADPYFLYSASNLGSLLALLGYPVVLEPLLGLEAQSVAWTAGYAALAVLIGASAIVLGRRVRRPALESAAGPAAAIRWGRRAHWVLLAAAPSSLLIGVTTHITTDVAAVPLLWVIPLALYLLTFVIVFARRPILSHGVMVRAMPYAVVLLVMALVLGATATILTLPIHLLAFFVIVMVCHGELARLRPPAAHLTEYYLWMAFGGVLGGALTALLAPVVFDSVVEYPLALILACALRPPAGETRQGGTWFRPLDLAGPAALALLLLVPILIFGVRLADLSGAAAAAALLVFFVAGGVAVFAFRGRPVRFALGVAVLLVAAGLGFSSAKVLERDRSFFGAYRVMEDPTGRFRLLMHGTTLHGAQRIDGAGPLEPLTYFVREGPLGQVFAALRQAEDSSLRVGVVGLGTGSIACYRRPGEEWTYYEIDPLVERLARGRRHFRFLEACASGVPVVIGDARLSLQEVPGGAFDLLVIDAFSSDAIPVHLVTREALDLYLRLLAPDGVLALNISNRNVDLRPVLGNLVAGRAMTGRSQRFHPVSQDGFRSASEWVVVTRTPERMAEVAGHPLWTPLPERPEIGLWTDDFSNIVRVLKWGGR